MGSVVSNLGEHSNMRIAFFLIVVATISFTSARPKRRNDELMFNPSMVRQDGPLNMEALNMLHADAVKYGQGAKNNKWFEAVDAKTLDGMITQMNTMNRWFAKVVKYWDDFTSGGDGAKVLAEQGKGINEDEPVDGDVGGDDEPAADGKEPAADGEPTDGDGETTDGDGETTDGDGEATDGDDEPAADGEKDPDAGGDGEADAGGDKKEGGEGDEEPAETDEKPAADGDEEPAEDKEGGDDTKVDDKDADARKRRMKKRRMKKRF